jgi:O-antigen/teichoic acid export membrane protein
MTFPEKTEAMEQHPSMLKKVLRGFSVSVALKMGRLLINLVLMSFLARHIGREGFGLLSATMALVAVLLCLVELGCQEILQRDLVHGDQDPLTLGSVFFTRLAVGVLCYVALLAYASTTQLEKRALLLIYGSLLMTHAATVVIGWLLARHHVSSVAWAQFWGFLVSAAAIAAGLVARAPLWYFAVTYVVECWAVILITIAMFRRYGGRFRRWNGPERAPRICFGNPGLNWLPNLRCCSCSGWTPSWCRNCAARRKPVFTEPRSKCLRSCISFPGPWARLVFLR